MSINILFISNNVRDYIKNLDHEKNISTIAMTFTLYSELCTFINKIKKFETIDKKKTLIKLLAHIGCSAKYNETERKDKLNFFIESLDIMEIDTSIKNIIINMKDALLSMILKYNKDSCKIEINKLLNNYFKSYNFKQVENEEYLIIKNELSNASLEDRELFMKYFNYVECLDEQCENYKITNNENNKSKINLIKDINGKIILLELFNSKNVQININSTQTSVFENIISKFKTFIEEKIKNISDLYSKKFLEQYYKNNKIGGDIWPENCNASNCSFAVLMMLIAPIIGGIIINMLREIPYFDVFAKIFFGMMVAYSTISSVKNEIKLGGSIYGIFNLINLSNINIGFSFNVYKLIISLKKSIIDSFITHSINIDKSIKDSLNIYLTVNILPIMKKIFFLIINFFKFNKFGGENINLIGGENNKCFVIPDLKINLLNKFLSISTNNSYQNFKECDKYNKIDIGNKNYILSGDNQLIKTNNFDCLYKTNLYKQSKKNNTVMWNNFNKNINTSIDIQITPTILQILKDSLFPSIINYQLGGYIDKEEVDKLYIQTTFKDITIQYSYQIINLLKKALFNLNNSGIILDDNNIKNIEQNIKILTSLENELYILSKKIIDIIKKSSNIDNTNIILYKYITEYKSLLGKSNKIAKKLNILFIDIVNIVDIDNN